MNLAEKEWRLDGVMLLILTVLFLVDIVTPHGFTNHVLYATVVLIATVSTHVWMPSVVAGIGSILTVLGIVIGPTLPGLPTWMLVGNRLFTIAMLWILVWFAWKRQEAELALKLVNEHLEDTVTERTRELATVNRALVSEITDRMEAEQALRLSEGRLAGILDIAEDAVIVTEHDRSISLFNQGAAKNYSAMIRTKCWGKRSICCFQNDFAMTMRLTLIRSLGPLSRLVAWHNDAKCSA